MKLKIVALSFFLLFLTLSGVSAEEQSSAAAFVPQDSEEMLESFVVYPAETKSPRATLESFLFLTQSYYDLIREDGFTSENIEELENIELQIMKLFDLREVPPRFQETTSMEAAVYLREALERVPLPPIETVPDERGMAEMIEKGIAPFYRIPGTLIEIERISDGSYAGHYQFTDDTLDNAELIYDQSEEYPPRRVEMEGFYEAYFLTPGPLIPLQWIRSLPNWMTTEYAEQTLWQWIALGICIIGLFFIIIILSWFIKHLSRCRNPLQCSLLQLIRPIVVIILTLMLIEFLDEQVFLTGVVLQVVTFIAHLTILYCSIVLILVASRIVAELILISDRFKRSNLNQYLIRVGVRLLGIGAAIVILIQGLHRLGFSLATLLAGASVTGLAVALAAQDTLKNIFGSIMLLLDKPFVVGQRIQAKGHDGFVEEIGLRSTRIRTARGHVISIPNEDLAKTDIKTIGHPGYLRRKFSVTITYDTPLEKIKRAVEIIKDILALPEEQAEKGEKQAEPHPNAPINTPGLPPRVYFNDLNADSLNIVVYYWYQSSLYWDFVAHSEWVNMRIMERFNAEGIDFAFPTQTVYLAGDEKRPLGPGKV